MFQQYTLYLNAKNKKKFKLKKNLSATTGIKSKALDAHAKNVTAELKTHHVCPLVPGRTFSWMNDGPFPESAYQND